jgi:hypothetical protein
MPGPDADRPAAGLVPVTVQAVDTLGRPPIGTGGATAPTALNCWTQGAEFSTAALGLRWAATGSPPPLKQRARALGHLR